MFPYCIRITPHTIMKSMIQLFRMEFENRSACCPRCHKKLFMFLNDINHKHEYCCCTMKTLIETDYNSLQRLNQFQMPVIQRRVKKKIEYTYVQGQEENIEYTLSVNHKIYIKC